MAPSRQSTTANKSRPTQRRGKNNNLNKDESQSTSSASEEKPFLLLEDVTCKICLNFMVRPVTLPCKHDLCYVCYENCVAKSNLACPMCRKRISVWCRQATKTNTVVNEVLWQRIQAQFPELVEAQNEGKDEKDTEDFFPTVAMHQFAEPGEVGKEFEAAQERQRREEEERRLEEEKASADLLAALQAEEQERLQREVEERRLEEEKASADLLLKLEREQAELERARREEQERIRQEDMALALELSENGEQIRKLRGSTVINTPPSTRKRTRKISSDAKTTPAAKKINSFFTSRSNSNENDEPSGSPSAFVPVTEHFQKRDFSMSEPRSSSCASSESIDQEVTKRLHFRPINAAPLTPPKSSPGNSQIVKPQVVSATAKNLSQLYELEEEKPSDDGGAGDVNHNQPSGSTAVKGTGVLAEELMEMEREWLRQKNAQEEADRELARRMQEELNEETRPRVNRSKGSADEYELRTNKRKNQLTIKDSFKQPSRKSNPLP